MKLFSRLFILIGTLIALIVVLLIMNIPTEEVQVIPEPEPAQEDSFVDEILEIDVPEEAIVQEEIETDLEYVVEIRNLRFYPDDLVIPTGSKVTFINNDTAPHKVVAYDRTFYGPRLLPGEEWSYVFEDIGSHRYFDAVFTKVGRGKITVSDEPLPITAAVIGTNRDSSAFAILVVMFAVFAFALSHGIRIHHKK